MGGLRSLGLCLGEDMGGAELGEIEGIEMGGM